MVEREQLLFVARGAGELRLRGQYVGYESALVSVGMELIAHDLAMTMKKILPHRLCCDMMIPVVAAATRYEPWGYEEKKLHPRPCAALCLLFNVFSDWDVSGSTPFAMDTGYNLDMKHNVVSTSSAMVGLPSGVAGSRMRTTLRWPASRCRKGLTRTVTVTELVCDIVPAGNFFEGE